VSALRRRLVRICALTGALVAMLIVPAGVALAADDSAPSIAIDEPWFSVGDDGVTRVVLWFAYSSTCSHCQAAAPWVTSLDELGWVETRWLQMNGEDQAPGQLAVELAASIGGDIRYVPTFMYCGVLESGFDQPETTGVILQSHLEACRDAVLEGGAVVPPVTPPDRGGDPGNEFGEGRDFGTISDLPSFEPVPGGIEPGGPRVADESRVGNATVIVVLLGLLAFFVLWRVLRLRRRYRFLAPGDRQWQRLAFAADRAGIAQRPAETFYEYASWLEEQLPQRRAEIHQIADGKVWQSYSGRSITSEAIARLERAWGKLQLPMLWLALRRSVRSLLRGSGS